MDVVQLVHRLERVVDPSGGIPLTDRVLEASRKALADRPGDLAKLDFFEGVFASDAGMYERAIEAFERVMAAPQVPVSLDGIVLTQLKGQAVLRRVESAIDLAERADPDQRQALMERVARYREEVNRTWPEGTPALLLIDARIAYLKGDLPEAQRLAVAYQRESGGQDPQANFLLSAIYMDRNQPGEALRELERFLELNPNVPMAWAQLSALRERLGDRSGAMEAIERAAQMAPDDPDIARRYEMMRYVTRQAMPDDPVTRALIEAQQLTDTTGGVSPKYDQAEALLAGVLNGGREDPRLYNALATIQTMQGKHDQALATIDRGLARYPDDQTLGRPAHEGAAARPGRSPRAWTCRRFGGPCSATGWRSNAATKPRPTPPCAKRSSWLPRTPRSCSCAWPRRWTRATWTRPGGWWIAPAS
ncbi:MAG: hypothetical protein KatS3mg103_0616 [Phycisphaerales bacterium]|nr:MAG: hypothetical protein KatS3mg103_0616 [Phycisphaerales bacterium]